MRSLCRGVARKAPAPKRSRSNRLAPTAIISIAQHARPNVIGHSEFFLAQLMAKSRLVTIKPSSKRFSIQDMLVSIIGYAVDNSSIGRHGAIGLELIAIFHSIHVMPTALIQRVAVMCMLVSPMIAAAADEHPPIHVNHPALKKLGWQMAAEAATFRGHSTFEMIELLHSLDCHHIELAPGQPLSADRPGVIVGHDMAAADVDALLAKLNSVKMDIVSY